ncbi:ribonuclease H [Senna tora]|uniref:Ribonuclease H n=1 Tax=Senna tora TaxID=362788 RepID=A0A834WK11_9FABA|nr:ribonuclease H [Senna tora]
MGIHHGLRIAHDMGINHLDLECNSALAVKTFTGVNVGDMQNHLTVWSIKELLRLNCDVGISQIPISLNTCADRLAKSSLNCEGGLLILNSPPKVDSEEHENMDDNGNIDDNIDGTNEYDITEPPNEQLYTDSDRENDVNKYGIELGYWNGGEESERSVE